MSDTIPKGWKWVKLGEVLNSGLFELLDRYRIPLSDNQRNKMKDGILYPYYGANGIIDYVNRYIFDGEFILVAEDGTVSTDKGKPVVQYVCGKFWVSNHAHVIKCENSITLKFLYYALKNVDIIPYITGAVQPKLNQRNLLDIEILYALDINEQKAIAEVLSSIDDKIDLLHRQNKTLEEMAMTLFRQWFIEPTKDGLPEGWEEVELSKLGQIVCGKTPSKNKPEYFGGKIPFIKIPDMHGNVFVFKTEDTLSEIGAKTQKNKTLPERSICVSCIATVGLVSMNAFISQTNQQINSIIPYKEFYRYFLYLKTKSIKEELIAMASGGTATLNLNTTEFSKIKIEIPKEDYLHAFHEKIKYIFEKIFINTSQIQTLEKLRDTLLPKLMSGELRVKV
jgi:type I restriction enzyme S subunit